jgi:hypothetical protein
MDGQHSVGFQSIKHPLGLVVGRGAEVEVHTSAFRGTSPLRQFIQELVIQFHTLIII